MSASRPAADGAPPRRADQRLPSGRHGLSRADVASSQRARIVLALFDAVAEKGYPATTIGDVVDRAEVSRRTFYEHFTSKEACFLAAFDEAVADVGVQLAAVLDPLPKDDWRTRIRQSWRAFLTALAASPTITWSLYVETFSAGPALIERTSAVNAGFAEVFRKLHRLARKQEPAVTELAPEVFDLYIGGTAERIRHCLRTDGAAALPALEDLFVDTLLALFGTPSA
ncbi:MULTISPECIES: TetR/AcrR family transcriptional regulator [Actinokineospora]|uniref:TetR family transcriptional regulator n=1 Tax=Actinokineospora fastidiosa TaxID=1816 RepID=A0A918GCN6_9PSEU|nr:MULTISPECIES: TetR/AcrR family transcriptional regulator [Actinokineospora]UVS79476.1 mycofactocin system transcriptional regulator [Actinokineospora sp. UTMC 2448]GGS29092.1 TetR family transcriptional regulator [Actinokineospora fastidiosa]